MLYFPTALFNKEKGVKNLAAQALLFPIFALSKSTTFKFLFSISARKLKSCK